MNGSQRDSSTLNRPAGSPLLFLFLALLGLIGIACSTDKTYPLPRDPLFDPVMITDVLLTGALQDTNFDGGLQVKSRGITEEPFSCRVPEEGQQEVYWDLTTPPEVSPRPALASVIFTIFPSNQAARRAWNAEHGTMACSFRVRRNTSVAFLPSEWLDGRKPPCPARLTEGSLIPEPITGFSSGQALMGNLIVRTITLSQYVESHADAEVAVVLLHNVEAYIAEILQAQTRASRDIGWPFSFVPCS